MMRCAECSTELIAPERSEYWSDKHVCHVWLCPECGTCFSTLFLLPADTKAMKDILAADPSLLPSLLVA